MSEAHGSSRKDLAVFSWDDLTADLRLDGRPPLALDELSSPAFPSPKGEGRRDQRCERAPKRGIKAFYDALKDRRIK